MRALITCCALLLAPLALADDSLRWLDQERRQRETLERDQRLRQLQRPAPSPQVPAVPSTADQHCWQLPGVTLQGNRLISDQALQQALRPHVAPCMGVNAIRRVLARISQLYIQHGYIATRAYPTQPPEDGQPLSILIEEGFVEAIELDGPDLPISLRNAFPDLIGKPLHLPTLEQGLDQLNRLRSIDVEAQIAPGDLPGGSRIILAARSHLSPWGARVTYGNGGDRFSGRHGASLVLSRDNPLQLNDALQVSLFGTFGNTPNYNRALGLYYSVPYGPWTLGASLARSQQVAFTPVGRHRNTYLTDSRGLSLGRTLWRNQTTLLGAQLRLNQKQRQRWFNNRHLPVPDPRLTDLGLDLTLLWLGRATWSGQLGYSHSLNWLGADSRDYQQWRLALLRTQVWPGAGHYWRWDSGLETQYSPNRLPASEQWLLSSSTSVRGLRDSNIAASSAAVWRNNLTLAIAISPGWTVSPRVGLDYGRGWDTWISDQQHPALAAISTGASLAWPGGLASLDYRHAVVIKDGPRAEPGFWNIELKLDF